MYSYKNTFVYLHIQKFRPAKTIKNGAISKSHKSREINKQYIMENQNSEQKETSAGQGMGIAGLVLGVLAVIAAFIPCFGMFAVLFGVLATIFGAVGYTQAKKGNGGKGLPLAGLVLGIIATAFTLIWLMMFAGVASSALSGAGKILDASKELHEATKNATEDINSITNAAKLQMDSITKAAEEKMK